MIQIKANDEYMRISEVAEKLLVSTQTIRNYAFRGRLVPDLVTSGGTRLYKKETVERYMKENKR